MQYKDIIVHLEDNEVSRKRVRMGIALCKRYGAQLCGIFVEAPWQPPAVTVTNSTTSTIMISEGQGSIAWLEHHQKQHEKVQKELSSKLHRQFLAQTAEHDIPSKFIPAFGDLRGELIFHSRYHDLAILGYTAENYSSLANLGSLAAEIALQSGKPVLMLPHHEDSHRSDGHGVEEIHFPTNPLVAWNESSEASRAVQDALPLLEESEKVTLYINVDHYTSQGRSGDNEKLHDYFHLHNIRFNLVEQNRSHTSTGEGLLQCAQQENNDLIIMGAYGHSRLRELLLGGTTRYVLKHTHLPVLMSH